MLVVRDTAVVFVDTAVTINTTTVNKLALHLFLTFLFLFPTCRFDVDEVVG